MNDASKPLRTRVYRNHHLDSTRWNGYRPRRDDVVISTSVKAGTTWMQRIISLFVFGADEVPDDLWSLSPWIDQRFVEPIDVVLERIDAQQHRRFLKSHLPLDALPYDEQVRYIMVGRDTRDVFMSLWNHYHSYTDFAYEALAAGEPEGGPCPRCPDDLRVLWRSWMTRSSFPWEHDGWPFWSHHYHAGSFWQYRHLPNVCLVHYNDLLADLPGEMRRVADFLGIAVAEGQWPQLVEAARFDRMKADGPRLLPLADLGFEGGAQTFFFKGTNGRWRDALTTDDLDLYEQAASRLDPELRCWLETGTEQSSGS